MSPLSRISATIALGIILAIFLFNNYWTDGSYQSGCFLKHSTDWVNAICYDRRDPNEFSAYEIDREKPLMNWVPKFTGETGTSLPVPNTIVDFRNEPNPTGKSLFPPVPR